MTFVADILMVAGTFGVAFYCYVLSARLKRFSTLESGMGGAIAVLSAQVDDMTRALARAQAAATGSAATLESLTLRAETAAARLEVMLASLHDLPERSDDDAGDRRLRFVRRRNGRDEAETGI